MKLGIMQPYFLPYIGYFQLINAVDVFIVYDNIQYTKKSWINRNRLLLNDKDETFSLQLKKDSSFLNVDEREISADFNRAKLINKFRGAYAKAPFFKNILPLLESVVLFEENNLFQYIYHSLICLCGHLGIETKILTSSSVIMDHSLKGQEKVLAMCDVMGASSYINAFGGIDLYDKYVFRERGVDLVFLKSRSLIYDQFGGSFVPWLSIIDVLMFNPPEVVKAAIQQGYDLH